MKDISFSDCVERIHRLKPFQKEVLMKIDRQEDAMIYIFARDYHQARIYAAQAEIPRKQWKYIENESSLDGAKDIEVRMITGHISNPKYQEIAERLKYMEFRKMAVVKRLDW